MKRLLLYLILTVILLSGCSHNVSPIDGTEIRLSDNEITVNGNQITNDNTQAVYSANDIVFYLANQGFTYGEGTVADEHKQSEADAHTVVHITKPGTYVLSGKLSRGQIAVDLGEDAKDDPEALVTLILNDVDVTCKVAPAIIFYNVYECCESDEDAATKDVDTSRAGANVIIVDDTKNNINGSYVAKIYKSYELNGDGTQVVDSKKLHKYDGAFYSKMSMNVTGGNKGNGILNINAENEGLNSELHLTINGGIINITSGNDGINTNEDNVSVTTINGGTVNITCDGATGEGDGIDSNGWLVINGGTVISEGCGTSADAGIDSDKGIYINGGTVYASGNMLDHISNREGTYAVFQFTSRQVGGITYTLKDSDNKAVCKYAPKNAFTYLIIAGEHLKPGDYTLWQDDVQLTAVLVKNMHGGMPGDMRPPMTHGAPPEFPDDMKRPERPSGDENMMPPDNMEQMVPFDIGANSETSTTFSIIKGANYFVNVCPVQE